MGILSIVPPIRELLDPRALFVRGTIALAVAFFSLFAPEAFLSASGLAYGIFFLLDGGATLAATGYGKSAPGSVRRPYVAAGLASGLLGLVSIATPATGRLALVLPTGVWVGVGGAGAIWASVLLRRTPWVRSLVRHALGITGVASLLIAGLILLDSAAGSNLFLSLVATQAFLVGAGSLALGFEMSRHGPGAYASWLEQAPDRAAAPHPKKG